MELGATRRTPTAGDHPPAVIPHSFKQAQSPKPVLPRRLHRAIRQFGVSAQYRTVELFKAGPLGFETGAYGCTGRGPLSAPPDFHRRPTWQSRGLTTPNTAF